MFFRPVPAACAVAAAFALPVMPAFSQTTALETMVVTAARQVQRASEVLADFSVIDAQALRAAGPSATVADVLARQPGIEITRQGGMGTVANVMIRGSNNNHALVLVDGMRLGSTSNGGAAWGFIPLEQVDRIEVIRGSCSSLYGADALGGVIQIFTKRGDGPLSMYAEAGLGSWNGRSLNAGLSGGSDGWRYALSVGEQRGDSYSAIRNPANTAYNPDRDGYRVGNSSGSVSYSPKVGHEVGAAYVYSEGWNRYDTSFPTKNADYRQMETLYAANLYTRNRLLDAWTSTLKFGKSADNGLQYSNSTPGSKILTSQTQLQWQNDLTLPLGQGLLALERVEQAVGGNVAYTVRERSVNSLLAGWQAQAGAHRWQMNWRRDDNSQFGGKNTSSASYGYQFTSDWRASLSYGTAYKAPTFNDLYWPGQGNPNLRPETGENVEASLHYETERRHHWLTYYHNDIRNLIAWAPGAGGLWLPSNVERVLLTGWTFGHEARWEQTRLAASLDLQKPEDMGREKLLRYRARQIAKISASHDFGNFTLGGELLASGKRFNDQANTQKLPGYGIVNLEGSYRLNREWSLFARLNNVFDKQYEQVRDYATPPANYFIGVRYSPK